MAKNLNQLVVIWALGKVGQRVGNGESHELADIALQKAGARSLVDFGPTGDDDDDLIWGFEISSPKDALPGDVLQYRDYLQRTIASTQSFFKDDVDFLTDNVTEAEINHEFHTAIVKTNPGNGVLTVLEQNHGGNNEVVKSTAIRWRDTLLSEVVKRKMVTHKATGRAEMAIVMDKVFILVTGTLRVFRPTAR